jgi:hypothetical protein
VEGSEMKVAFLDHYFHKKTRSSNFFVDLLRGEYDVEVVYLDDDPRSQLLALADSDVDLFVCWQTEYACPFLLLRGKRVVCIAMYDGVATVPDWYWAPMVQARFLNFSRHLHERHCALGLDSEYYQYFGSDDLEVFPLYSDYSTLRGFFWIRRPEEGLDEHFANTILRPSISQLHVHNAPDSGIRIEVDPRVVTTQSEFGPDATAYRAALMSSNVYLCPRRTEGIGLAMLEAMAAGSLVIANNAPTANEYIIHRENGILINYDSPLQLDIEPAEALRLGQSARKTIEEGRSRWKNRISELLFFVSSTPAPVFSKKQVKFSDRYLEITPLFRADHWQYMRQLGKQMGRGLSGTDFSKLTFLEQTFWSWRRFPGARLAIRIGRGAFRRLRRFAAGF